MKYSHNDEPMILEKKASQKQPNQQIQNKYNKKTTKKVDDEKSGNIKTKSISKQELIDEKIKFFLEDGIKDVKYEDRTKTQTKDMVDENHFETKEEKERREREKQQQIDQAIQFFLEDGIKDIKQPTKEVKEELEQEKEEVAPPQNDNFVYENQSIEFLSTKLAEEEQNKSTHPFRIKLLHDILFNRISALTMRDQILLMKSASKKFSLSSSTYKKIRDNVLLNLMDKFVEKKYRQSLTLTPQTIETSHLGDIQKFVSMLSSDQVEALKKINRNYIPLVSANSPEYDHFREATKGIQATIDHSIDARGPGNNIYEDLQNDMDKHSFANQFEEQQKENNPIDVYKVSTPEQVAIAQALAEEVKESTGTHYQIVLSSDLILDSHEQDKKTEHTNDMYDAHVMEKNYTGNNSR